MPAATRLKEKAMSRSVENVWMTDRLHRIAMPASQARKAEEASHQAQFFVDLLFAAFARSSGIVAITERLALNFVRRLKTVFRPSRKHRAARYGA
jgi:hypothetical protein